MATKRPKTKTTKTAAAPEAPVDGLDMASVAKLCAEAGGEMTASVRRLVRAGGAVTVQVDRTGFHLHVLQPETPSARERAFGAVEELARSMRGGASPSPG
jgi:hypothetical protein